MKPHGRSQSSSSFSRLHLNSKSSSSTSQNSSKRPETISKYFTPPKVEYGGYNIHNLNVQKKLRDDQCSSSSNESPYKGSLTEIKSVTINTSANEEIDFKTPMQGLRKDSKYNNKLKTNLNSKKTNKKLKGSIKSNQMILTKSVKRNLKDGDDVNQEHLELALALSRSLIENHKENEENNDLTDYPSTQQKLANVKQTLLQFNYESYTSKMEVLHQRTPVQIKKKSRKSKFQYITPVLHLRTQEDRDRLISEKIALILSENEAKDTNNSSSCLYLPKQPESGMLEQQWNSESKIFKTCSLPLKDLNNKNICYVESLQISQNASRCGILLRDWKEIPGREKSPEPPVCSTNISLDSFEPEISAFSRIDSSPNKIVGNSPNKIIDNNCCISPDLFESDEEMLCRDKQLLINKSSQINDSSDSESQSLLKYTPSKKQSLNKMNASRRNTSFSSLSDEEIFTNDKGIRSYESFCKESDNKTLNYLDLTNSSDDEDKCEKKITKKDEIPKTGVSAAFQRLLCVNQEDNQSEMTRRSKSLNITDYIYNMLDNGEEKVCDLNSGTPNKQDELIDLTQSSSGSSNCNKSPLKLSDVNNDANDVSPYKNNEINFQRHESFKSTTSDDLTLSQASQESICINDEELNYSSAVFQKSNYEFSDDCDSDTEQNEYKEGIKNVTPNTSKRNLSSTEFDYECNTMLVDTYETFNQIKYHDGQNDSIPSKKSDDPLEDSLNALLGDVNASANIKESERDHQSNDNTPKNGILIKTTNVTPMVDYDIMNTPKINKELQKFGLKPLKRQRGVQLLKHIYDTTHPFVNQSVSNQDFEGSESDEDNRRVIKKRKSITNTSNSPEKCENQMSYENVMKASSVLGIKETIEIVGDIIIAANETVEDLIFERKQSAKISSCRVPLQIAWHNLLAAQPELRKNVLLYEPLQLEVLYKMLKDQGYKYHIEDLLTFLDKKCITIRTNQNQARNKQNKKRKSSPKKKTKGKSASPQKKSALPKKSK